MKDFGSLLQQAQGMQAKLAAAQARIAETTVEGRAGGGLVRLTLKGSGELVSVALDDSLFVAGEGEIVGDLLVAAHADAKTKLDAAQAQAVQESMGPLAGLMAGSGGLPGFSR